MNLYIYLLYSSSYKSNNIYKQKIQIPRIYTTKIYGSELWELGKKEKEAKRYLKPYVTIQIVITKCSQYEIMKGRL